MVAGGPGAEDVREAAWALQWGVYQVLSALVIGGLDSWSEPDAGLLFAGDVDYAHLQLIDAAPVLSAVRPALVDAVRAGLDHMREGRRGPALDAFLSVWDDLGEMSGRHLPLPTPPPGERGY